MHYHSKDQPFQILKTSQLAPKLQEQDETVLQAIIKLEDSSDQKYKIKFIQGQITLHTLSEEQTEPIKVIYADFDVKMSKQYSSRSQLRRKEQFFPKGIKLENQDGLNISFFFKTSIQAYTWVKTLSLYVNQLNFQKEFKVIRKLGRGASASVFQVRGLKDGKNLAVKVFSKQIFNQGQLKLQSLKKQIEILRNLNSFDIFGFDGVYQDEKAYYLVMQLVKGVNAFEFLLSQKQKIQASKIKLIMRSILQNLVCLQELDIVHRDIKLQNIIIDSATLKTNLIDYGLAVFADDEDYIFYNCGTPGYISPQTAISKKNGITVKSDIFSAGVILHILLTGRFLFEAKDVKDIMSKNLKCQFELDYLKQIGIDTSAIDLLKGMLCLKPEDRFSAQECLNHDFLRVKQQFEDEEKPSTPSTNGDIQNYQL